MIRSVFLLFIFLSSFSLSSSQEKKNYFYSGKNFGSEALYNPGSLLINAGFDILQSATHSRDLTTIKFGTGLKNVWDNVKDPFPRIRLYGVQRFINNEVFPNSLKLENAQWFPNYTLHLIGGGMDSRMTLEWYRYHDVPYPTLMTTLTIVAEHFINEAVENDLYVGPNVDPISDMWIFDTGGALLFSSDAVCEFFSSTLNMTVWPGQPAFNPEFHTLENHGQNYVIKYPLPFWSKTRLFYHFGDNGMLGLSFLQNNNESITVSGGFAARELRLVDVTNGSRTISITLGWIAGLFWDRDNSVLVSLMLSNRVNESVRLNIYPGIINLSGFSPGVFASIGNRNQFIAGFSIQYSPIGLAYRNKM